MRVFAGAAATEHEPGRPGSAALGVDRWQLIVARPDHPIMLNTDDVVGCEIVEDVKLVVRLERRQCVEGVPQARGGSGPPRRQGR